MTWKRTPPKVSRSRKGIKTAPPIIPTQEYITKFFANRTPGKLTNQKESQKKYYVSLLEAYANHLESSIDLDQKVGGEWRTPPRQLFNTIFTYLKVTLEYGRCPALQALADFSGLHEEKLNEKFIKNMNEPYKSIIGGFIGFIKMFIESTAQEVKNPAFHIFWLKNRGWKDKMEIEATAKGAMTEEEREAAQRRIENINE